MPHPPSPWSALIAALVVAVFTLSACSGSAPFAKKRGLDSSGQPVIDVGPTAGPTAMILRASFDDDPSDLIGKMLPDKLSPYQVDENLAQPSLCKKFVSYKVKNSSMTRDENLLATSSLGASIGYKAIASLKAAHAGSVTLRVQYTMTKKMIAYVKPENATELFKCCLAAPEQCTGRMLGEFVYGSGTLSQAIGSDTRGKAGGTLTKAVANAEVDYKDGYAWKRFTKFKDVYFAFRPLAGPPKPKIPTCAEWKLTKPSSPLGKYFIGISQQSASEAQAVRSAMFDAQRQVVSYLNTFVSAEMSQSLSTKGGILADTDVAKAATQGVASLVYDLTRCPTEKIPTPKGYYYKVHVLTFFPTSERKAATKNTLASIAGALEKKGRRTEAAKLKGLAAGLK